MTLKELLALHPEWADLPIAIYGNSGEYSFLEGGASVYKAVYFVDGGEDDLDPGEDVLVFTDQ